MIASLRGELTEVGAAHVVVDVGGVGFQVTVTATTLAALPVVGETVSLVVLTVVREDAITLYGFAGAEERDLYLALTSVSQIGPKLALQILGNLTPAELYDAIMLGDEKRLSLVPGVGKKSAARMVLELRDKLPGARPMPAAEAAGGTAAAGRANQSDLVDALTGLGFKRPEIAAAIKGLDAGPDEPLDELLRRALIKLTPKGK